MLGSHPELVRKNVRLPSSASQCLTLVSLAYMGFAFLGELCSLQKMLCGQKDLGWYPSPGLNARGGQLTLLSSGGYKDKM